MKVFTVTCLRDFNLFILQCRSIKKYLQVNEFNIVINQNDNEAKQFRKLYKEHIQPIFQDSIKINLINKSLYLPPSIIEEGWTGWVTQQILKLSLLDLKPYIVLDSKNIFVRPTSTDEFINGNRYIIEKVKYYQGFISECNKHFPADYSRGAKTPYIVNPAVCKKIFETFGGYEEFVKWFISKDMPSEFILHDMAAQHFRFDVSTDFIQRAEDWNYLLFDTVLNYKEAVDYVENNQQVKIMTLHPRVFNDNSFKDYIPIIISKFL